MFRVLTNKPGQWTLILVSAVSLLASALSWAGVASDLRLWHAHRALDARGISTNATVLSTSFDPDGGDPSGWTTDRVLFRTQSGDKVHATTGHHGKGRENAGGVLTITYDPSNAHNLRPAGYVDYDDDPSNAAVGAVLASGFSVLAGLAAGAAFLGWRGRRQGGRADDRRRR